MLQWQHLIEAPESSFSSSPKEVQKCQKLLLCNVVQMQNLNFYNKGETAHGQDPNQE